MTDMADASLEARYLGLMNYLIELGHAYHVLDAPLVPDSVYDGLYRNLEQLEAEHPHLVRPESPTQRVGGAPVKDLPTVQHQVPMLSIDNAMNAAEAEAYVRLVAAELGVDPEQLEFIREPKYDGLSCALRYKEGLLVQAVTRGDGFEGEDVTAQVRTIRSVPIRLSRPLTCEVRGEVVMAKVDFERLNERQRAAGEKEYANPRNAAAGSLRVQDPKVTASRRLTFYAYSLIDAAGHGYESHDAVLADLKAFGFKVSSLFQVVVGLSAVLRSFEEVAELRPNLPYEIDGVLYKVRRLDQQDALGWRNRTPRFIIAYKFPAEERPTLLKAIDVQVGRTGALTPVARLAPVHVGGVTVNNSTLHNEHQVNVVKGVRVGDTVIMRRAGDVIPELVRPVLELRPADAVEFRMPEHCPACGSAVRFVPGAEEGMGQHFCTGGTACPDQRLFRIGHYGSRLCLDIEGLGDATVQELMDAKLIEKISDLYKLTVADLKVLPGWGVTSATNLVTEIQKSAGRPLRRFIAALGIEGIGEGAAKVLAQHFSTWEDFSTATAAQLTAIDGIGDGRAESILAAFGDENTSTEMARLAALVKPEPEAKKQTGGPLAGRAVVVTGTLPTLSREEAKALVEKLGGKPSDSVSKKTYAVVFGESAGSKLKKAEDLKIPRYEEGWLLALAATADDI